MLRVLLVSKRRLARDVQYLNTPSQCADRFVEVAPTSIGIPYVRVELEGRSGYVTCPRCALRIKLTRKDFESFSNARFAEHFVACMG